jgi:hypothetical protein
MRRQNGPCDGWMTPHVSARSAANQRAFVQFLGTRPDFGMLVAIDSRLSHNYRDSFSMSSLPATSAHPLLQIQMLLLLAGCFRPVDQVKPEARSPKPESMTHTQLVEKAVRWLRHYRCGVVLSEQACASGEMPDAIGWKRASHSVLVECKVTRADFLVDRAKPFRLKPEQGVGSERFYLTPAGLLKPDELPAGWGLLEIRGRGVEMVHASVKNLRSATGFRYEMNLLLASLRRVELRIEPQSITDFLKWKNRMAEYNRGTLPEGLAAAEDEANVFLEPEASTLS